LNLIDIEDPEYDIFLTGDFDNKTSNNDDFIPLVGVQYTSVHYIYTVDAFIIPCQSLDRENVNTFGLSLL